MIIVTSSLPLKYNHNYAITQDLASAFAQIFGDSSVKLAEPANVITLIRALSPELLVMVGSPGAFQLNFREVANACYQVGSCSVFWTVEDPYEFDYNSRFTRFFDVVFSNDIVSLPFYNRSDVYHLPLAAKAVDLEPLNFDSRPIDLFFCGVAFPNRQALISDLLPLISRRRSMIRGHGWPEFPGDVVVNKRLSREELMAYYGLSRCVLNVGRNLSIANSRNLQAGTPGPRTFEAAAVGCLQLYHRPGIFLNEYFEPGTEILTFETVGEFRDILHTAIENPAMAQQIADAAQRRVLAEHTFLNRAQTILDKTSVSIPEGVKQAHFHTKCWRVKDMSRQRYLQKKLGLFVRTGSLKSKEASRAAGLIDLCRHSIRVQVAKEEGGAFNKEVEPGDLLADYESKIAALERLVKSQAPEIKL